MNSYLENHQILLGNTVESTAENNPDTPNHQPNKPKKSLEYTQCMAAENAKIHALIAQAQSDAKARSSTNQ